MANYRAPIKEMGFVINELVELDKLSALPGLEEASPDLVEAVLEEAGSLAAEVIAPTNELGDARGATVENGQVFVPEEFIAAYQQYIEGGWPSIVMNPEFGGQGLPLAVGVAVEEMLHAANMAWSLCPMLTQGAIHALESHGSDQLKALFLEKLIAGEWTGTMNITEPQAGSDLSLVRSTATPEGDGWRVSGQKIFITWGDHNMTDNIVHMVLARTPDAPEGVRGLSLFAVTKNLLDADGNSGDSNGVTTVSVEHKLGIHASPTCVLEFDNSLGQLVGELGHGLACMFTMMNSARLNVGLQGVGIADRAYQHALAYALERKQGSVAGVEGVATIVAHPDVRRMLLTVKAETEALRALTYVAMASIDISQHSTDEAESQAAQARVDFLTPLVKGWGTEQAQVLTSIALQVHGGMGYAEETGAAQFMRDARILTIYEGTTGIQAGDLMGRKILRDGGAELQRVCQEMQQVAAEAAAAGDALSTIASSLTQALESIQQAARWLQANYDSDANVPGAVSYHFLMMLGTACGGWQMARAALVAKRKLDAGDTDTDFYTAKLGTATFYAEQSMPRVAAHATSIGAGCDTMMAFTREQLESQ